jgi:AcrR family transcriptional regulator
MVESGLSGRQGQARRNDDAILSAARAVLVANPDAPVAAVASRAGVSMSAMYRRYPAKEDLLIRLCADGLDQYVAVARAAVDDRDGDPWDVFATFMAEIVSADTITLATHLAGRFTPTAELQDKAALAFDLNERIIARAQGAGVLRRDVNAHDLSNVFEQVASIAGDTAERTAQLRARYLALHLDALCDTGRRPLPGPPPTADEIAGRWRPRST